MTFSILPSSSVSRCFPASRTAAFSGSDSRARRRSMASSLSTVASRMDDMLRLRGGMVSPGSVPSVAGAGIELLRTSVILANTAAFFSEEKRDCSTSVSSSLWMLCLDLPAFLRFNASPAKVSRNAETGSRPASFTETLLSSVGNSTFLNPSKAALPVSVSGVM